MLDFSSEVLNDAEARQWIETHRNELGMFEAMKTTVDEYLSYSYETLRENELNAQYIEDNDWN